MKFKPKSLMTLEKLVAFITLKKPEPLAALA